MGEHFWVVVFIVFNASCFLALLKGWNDALYGYVEVSLHAYTNHTIIPLHYRPNKHTNHAIIPSSWQ